MDALVGDSFLSLVSKLMGVAAVVWVTAETSDAAPILKHLTKDARAYVLGPLFALVAYICGFVGLESSHPAMIESWPRWAHLLVTLTGVGFLGFCATQTARYGDKLGNFLMTFKAGGK